MDRPSPSTLDAIVVGSGPNGLAAAITLATAGRSVRVLEGAPTIGGGARSGEATLPGYIHDHCSAVHPMAAASPFFRSLPLERHGLRWIRSPAALAHPQDDGSTVLLESSVGATAAGLDGDGPAYRSLMEPLHRAWGGLVTDLLAPIHMPVHPLSLARFGMVGLQSAERLARRRFAGPRARALMAGLAAHAVLPMDFAGTSAFALVLALCAHGEGWPIAAGGSQRLSDALAAHLRELGGTIETGPRVTSLDALPRSRVVLLDVPPRSFNALAAGRRNPKGKRLARFRHGPGVFKMDWALDGPIPWTSAECRRAATVHLGGAWEEIAQSEAAVGRGGLSERPFVILAQPSLFDRSRVPPDGETAWGYCHVPNGSVVDAAARIEAQIERFAPGFRDRILARRATSPAGLEAYNPNLIGGDISGGASDLGQLFTRPLVQAVPYATGVPGVYLCSASTPPGGGVHGMCGHHAALAALRCELR